MDPHEPFFTAEFGKDIAKSLIISAASTVGVMGGMILLGFITETVQKRKNKKSGNPIY